MVKAEAGVDQGAVQGGGKKKSPITHVLLVVDMSGSMSMLAEDVRGGFNEFVASLRRDGGRYRVTATLFDTAFELLCVAAKLRDVPVMTADNYRPRGGTALRDAVGKTLAEFEATKLGDDERVMVVVQTDGKENSSKEFSAETIAQMIADREKTGRWMFNYLGAGPDAWDQGHSLGFSNNVHTEKSAGATRSAYSGIAVAAAGYSRGASVADTYEVLNEAAGGEKTPAPVPTSAP